MAAQATTQVEPEKELVAWIAPSRPFKRRDREFYVSIIAIGAIFGAILFLIDGVLPVIFIASIIFLYYVMSNVEPEEVNYKITNRGIKIADKTTSWEVTRRFWFNKRLDSDLLIIETAMFPGRLEIVINPGLKKKIEEEIKNYIPLEEAPPSYLDKAAKVAARRLPIKQ